MIQYPDYGHSILSIAASIQRHYGLAAPHPSLPMLDGLLAKPFRHVAVLLFDGLGVDALARHLPEDAFLRRHQQDVLSSVFPPTTTAATIAIETGLSPIEHGWLGWSLYFPELDANVDLFPNTLGGSDGKPAADYHVARHYLPTTSIVEQIASATDGRVRAECVSPYGTCRVETTAELFEAVRTISSEDTPSYIYAYWPQPDYDMHDLGVTHENVAAFIHKCNADVEALCHSLRDTLIIVTADHGLIDTNWRYLADYPDIQDCLLRFPSIEPRALNFFLKPGCQETFARLFQEAFGEDYLLFSKEEVLARGLFGPGTPHPRVADTLGDYLAVATGPISIECGQSRQAPFQAAHAGLTQAEMEIPFIAIPCP